MGVQLMGRILAIREEEQKKKKSSNLLIKSEVTH